MPQYKITLPDGTAYRVTAPSESAAYLALQQSLAPSAEPVDTGPKQGRGGVLPVFAESFATGLTDIPGGIADLLGAIGAVEKPEETGAYQFSESARKTIQDVLGIDPNAEATTAETGAQALGSLASFFVPGLGVAKVAKGLGAATKAASIAGRVATGVQAGSLGAQQQAQSIRAQEAQGNIVPEANKNTAIIAGSLIGLTDLIPLEKYLGPLEAVLSKVPLAKAGETAELLQKSLPGIIKSATVEGAQEGVSQLAQNIVEKGLYNPDLALTEGLLGNTAAGGFAGGTIGAILELTAGRKIANFNRKQTQLFKSQQEEARAKAPQQVRGEAISGINEIRAAAPAGEIKITSDTDENGVSDFVVRDAANRPIARFSSVEAATIAARQYEQESGGLAKLTAPTLAEASKNPVAQPTAEEKKKGKKLAKVLKKEGALNPAPVQAPASPEAQAATVQSVAQAAAQTPATPAEAATLANPSSSAKPIMPKGRKRIAPVAAPVQGAVAAPPVSTTAAEIPAPVTPVSRDMEFGTADERAAIRREIAPQAETFRDMTPEQQAAYAAELDRRYPGRTYSVPPVETPAAPQAIPAAQTPPVRPSEAPPAAVPQAPAPTQVTPTEKPLAALFVPNTATTESIKKLEAFKNVRAKVADELNRRLAPIAGKGVRVNLVDAVLALDAQGRLRVGEGAVDSAGDIITLSYNIYDPNLSVEEHVDKLFDVMNHEVIHSLVNMGKLNQQEMRTLFEAAQRTKYGKNSFTYFDRAYAMYRDIPNYTPEMILEEAVAEMFRDARAGRLDLTGKPKGIFQSVVEFFRRLFSSYDKAGVSKIFKDIESGKVGAREARAIDGGVGKFSVQPELRRALEPSFKQLRAGEITREEFDRRVNEIDPVRPYKSLPEAPTLEQVRDAIGAKGRADGIDRIGLAHRVLKTGDRVTSRLDINAYQNNGVWVETVRSVDGKFKGASYDRAGMFTNVKFDVNERTSELVAAGEVPKSPFAVIEGDWVEASPEEIQAKGKKVFSDPAWRQVGMDPRRHSYFYDRKTMEPIVAAEEVIQIGPLVLAKNATTAPARGFKYSVIPTKNAVVGPGGVIDPATPAPTAQEVAAARADTTMGASAVRDRLPIVVPEQERVIGGQYNVGTPDGRRWSDLTQAELNTRGGGFDGTDADLQRIWEDTLREVSEAARVAVDRTGATWRAFPAASWNKALRLPTRAQLWYELSGETFIDDLPDLVYNEHMMFLDLIGATSARAKPSENLERALAILSQRLRRVPIDVDITIQSTVAEALQRNGQDVSSALANKTGMFSDTLALAGGLPVRFPISVNDVWVGKAFGVSDDKMSANQALHEVFAKYTNKLRNLVNNQGKHQFPHQSWNLQARQWVELRAADEGVDTSVGTTIEGSDYAGEWDGVVQKLKDAGIPIVGRKISRDNLMDPRFADALRSTTPGWRAAPKATVEFGTLMTKNGRDAAKVIDASKQVGDKLSPSEYLKILSTAMFHSARGKRTVWDDTYRVASDTSEDVTRIYHPKATDLFAVSGTFEGAASPNIRVPLKNLTQDQIAYFNSVVGRGLKQKAMAAAEINVFPGSIPPDYVPTKRVLFKPSRQITEKMLTDFTAELGPGFEISVMTYPDGVTFDINPKDGTIPVDPVAVTRAVNKIVSDHGAKSPEIFDAGFKSEYNKNYVDDGGDGTVYNQIIDQTLNDWKKDAIEKLKELGLTEDQAKLFLDGTDLKEATSGAAVSSFAGKAETIRKQYAARVDYHNSVSAKWAEIGNEIDREMGEAIPRWIKRIGKEDPALAAQLRREIGLSVNENPKKFSIPAQETGVNEEEFARWFKQSDAVNPDGTPMRYYRGDPRPLEGGELRTMPIMSGGLRGEQGPFFFSPTPTFASDFAIHDLSAMGTGRDPGRGVMTPVYLSVQNPWDYKNPNHVERLVNYITDAVDGGKGVEYTAARNWWDAKTVQRLEAGYWKTIERPAIQRAIRDLGYDGFYLIENGSRNLAIYNPSQAKSIFNRFEPGTAESRKLSISPEIRTAEGVAKSVARTGEATQAEVDIANQSVEQAVRKISVVPKEVPMPPGMDAADEKIFATAYIPSSPGVRIMEIFGGFGSAAGRTGLMDRFRVEFVQQEGQVEKYERAELIKDAAKRWRAGVAEYSTIAALDQHKRHTHLTLASLYSGAIKVMALDKNMRAVPASDPSADPDSIYLDVSDDPDNALFRVMDMVMTGGPNGDSLFKQFRAYAIAQVSKRRISEGKKVPSNVTAQYIAEADNFGVQYPVIAEAFTRYQTFNTQMIQAAADAGAIPQSLVNELTDDQNYFSMYRELGDGAEVPVAGGGVAKIPRFKEYRGSVEGNVMADPFEAIVHNVMFWTNLTSRTIASRKAYELGKRMGIVRQLKTYTDPNTGNLVKEQPDPAKGEDPRVLNTRINGNDVRFATTDPLFATGLMSTDYSSLSNALKFLGMPADVLRESVTRDPGFMIANLLRDSVSTWSIGTSGANPAATFKGLLSAASRSDTFKRMYRFGTIGSFAEAQKSPRQIVQSMKKKIIPTDDLLSLTGAVKAGWDKLELASEASDAATRIAVYEDAIKNGATEFTAAYRALSIMNFSRSGHSSLIRGLSRVIPFLNARIQGFDVLYRGLKTGVMTATGQEQLDTERTQGVRVLYRAAGLAAASLLLHAMQSDDDEYKNIPRYIKDSNTVVGIGGGKFLTIPKPFEAGFLFMTVPTTMYDVVTGDRSSRSAMKLFVQQFGSTFGFNPIPQFMLPITENYINVDLFTGQPLVSPGIEKLDPSLQYNASTSYVARGLSELSKYTPFGYSFESGRFEGISPVKIDNLITGYGGPIGSYISMALGGFTYAFGSDNQGLPVPGSKLPVIRRFFIDAQDMQPQAAADAYELYQVVDSATRTMARLRKSGDFEAMREFRAENVDLLRAGPKVRRMTENLSNIRAQMRRLEADKTMSYDQKLEKMRELRAREARVTRSIADLNRQLGR